MKEDAHKAVDKYRILTGRLGSDPKIGNNGAFLIPFRSYTFVVVCSDGGGWDHVSVSLKNRCPNWEEMCFVKNIFWSEDETVIQFHPKQSEYVNNAENCLHLWKNQNVDIELPPSIYVGLKGHGS